MSYPEWYKKIEEALGDDNNPTKYSLLYTLSNMAKQLEEYKKLGSIKELKTYKNTALEQSDDECAKWVECETADYNWCCSKCGFGYTDNKLPYCYDCGAKMNDD